ncbi:MAG: FAD-dependent oxidoreductase [Vicinamibacterales bacterium]|nr:FAD-dependent oxidoreductase [Vicinamibacterales bacterium]
MATTVSVTIDGRTVAVDPGTTVLAAARGLGIRIPTLCHVDGFPPSSSCFLCAVQVEGKAALSPSCAMPVADGMVVHTDTQDVRASRKMALELLLSDHAGDCVGPCMTGCPARFDIPGFLTRVADGDDRRSAEIASDFLVLPAALGRICPRLCEERCHRCDAEAALSVGGLHRFAADNDLASGDRYVPRKDAPTGKRIAIVGAGPAGLSAAYNLLRRGHDVVIIDAHAAPGGMLRYGIPAFRLPHDVLDREIDTIRVLGAEFRMGQRLGTDVWLDDLRREFDAVFLALGAQRSRGLDCPGDELAMGAVEFLGQVAGGTPPDVGLDVLVLGGGNTAMDAARTAVRLGAARVTVLYRRTRREMPCLMAEVEAAEAEGVRLETLAAPVGVERTGDGRLRLTCVRMALGPPDESGRARPVPVPDSTFSVDATCVVAAIGQDVDGSGVRASAVQLSRRGIVVDPATLATNLPGIFAGGDAVTGADLAVRAVAAGKLAAVSIDQYVGGRPVQGDPEMVTVLMTRLDEGELAAFFREVEQAPRAPVPERPVSERISDFGEVEGAFAPDVARSEAARCMHCGCSKATTCELRQYSTEYGVDPLRFAGARRKFERDSSHPEMVYEPGKCILCGACVAVAAAAGDGIGLAIVGRGFEASVAVPLRGTLVEALPTVARQVADICPTGAFGLKGAGSCASAAPPRPILRSDGRAATVIPLRPTS